MSDDNPRDLPRDIRHDWQYMTFAQLKDIMDERDRRYELQFKNVRSIQTMHLVLLAIVAVLALALLIVMSVALLSGVVH